MYVSECHHQSISQSINRSKQVNVASYVANESETHKGVLIAI